MAGFRLLRRTAALAQDCIGLQAGLLGGLKGGKCVLRRLRGAVFCCAQTVERFGTEQGRHGFGPARFGLLHGLGQTVEALAGLSDIFLLLGLCLAGGFGLAAGYGKLHGALCPQAFVFIGRGAGLLGRARRAFCCVGNFLQGVIRRQGSFKLGYFSLNRAQGLCGQAVARSGAFKFLHRTGMVRSRGVEAFCQGREVTLYAVQFKAQGLLPCGSFLLPCGQGGGGGLNFGLFGLCAFKGAAGICQAVCGGLQIGFMLGQALGRLAGEGQCTFFLTGRAFGQHAAAFQRRAGGIGLFAQGGQAAAAFKLCHHGSFRRFLTAAQCQTRLCHRVGRALHCLSGACMEQGQQFGFSLTQGGGQGTVLLGLARLACQLAQSFAQLLAAVFGAGQVAFCGAQLELGLVPAGVEAGDTCGFFQNAAPFLRACAHQHGHAALTDHGRRARARCQVGKEGLHIPRADGAAVDPVIAASPTLGPAADLEFVQFRETLRAEALGTFKGEGDFRQRTGRARCRARKNEIVHFAAAQGAGGGLAHDPAQGFHHVGFAAPVRPDNTSQAGQDFHGHRVGKAFETGNAKPGETDGHDCAVSGLWLAGLVQPALSRFLTNSSYESALAT